MNSIRFGWLAVLVGATAMVPVLWATQAPAAKPQAPRITGTTLLGNADQKWVPMPGLEGAQQTPLWGDSTKEAHGILYRWPAGTKVPVHTHTHGDRGVVLSGTLILTVEGKEAKKLPAGSYFSMAGGTKHATATTEDAPCVFFLNREGPFDVVMAEEAGAKK